MSGQDDGGALHVLDTPLEGVNLVEANAGTGKTWNITALFLRLVLERGLSVGEILVLTYTVAATEELRDRIRRRLHETAAALRGGGGDEFVAALVARLPARDAARRRLDGALRAFDEAAVFTIHGFCQRVLADTAFESGVPFAAEILADDRELVRELIEDFWRREVGEASPLWAACLLDHLDPGELQARLGAYVAQPFLRVLTAPAQRGCEQAEDNFRRAYEHLRSLWRDQRERVVDLLLQAPGLHRGRYRQDWIQSWAGQLDDWLAVPVATLRLPEKLHKFAAAELAVSLRKGGAAPRHPFFGAVDRLIETHEKIEPCFRARLGELQGRLLAWLAGRLPPAKRARGVRAYQDLLLELHGALGGPRRAALVDTLRRRHPVALIDEFQDTDPLQYDILQRIYDGQQGPVFLVGDPKQAIYSFRGADVYAYLRGRRGADARWTLERNYRSTPSLVRAVNTLFSASPRPFVIDEIAFHPSTADRDDVRLTLGDRGLAPLTLWLLPRDSGDGPWRKDAARGYLAEAVASEITRLLADGRADGTQLCGQDIAVLVRSHREGRYVREELAARGVASVLHTDDDVFASGEALELERVLRAVAQPAHEGCVRGALATEMLGYDAARIARLQEDEAAWQALLERFHRYHRQWRERGFVRMYRELLADAGVHRRLLARSDGERRLTNLLHLEELVQARSMRRRGHIDDVLNWLADARRSDLRGDEEAQLRLESDEQLVQIVTIHRSKGLQYRVVFCPYLWDGYTFSEDDEVVSFHDPRAGYRATLDLGSARRDEHRRQAVREEFAEKLRLAYVALTRARDACYLAWGVIGKVGAGKSALAWLLHPPPDPTAETAAHVAALDDATVRRELERLCAAGGGSMAVSEVPAPSRSRLAGRRREDLTLRARELAAPPPAGWRLLSYSALAPAPGAGPADFDAARSAEERRDVREERSIFGFPRGARAGRCLHAFFERCDFRARDDHERLAGEALVQHGFDADWAPVVAATAARVLDTPLDGGALRLGAVPRGRRLDELEFHYPVAGSAMAALAAAAGSAGAAPVATADGYMRGFIDLVFEAGGRWFVVDYKSNWLGAGVEDYAPARLAEAVAENRYRLQYLIYLLALHRFLRRRLPGYDYERHVGGVYYLFLRGMDPRRGDGCGVYHDRPAAEVVARLDAAAEAAE